MDPKNKLLINKAPDGTVKDDVEHAACQNVYILYTSQAACRSPTPQFAPDLHVESGNGRASLLSKSCGTSNGVSAAQY